MDIYNIRLCFQKPWRQSKHIPPISFVTAVDLFIQILLLLFLSAPSPAVVRVGVVRVVDVVGVVRQRLLPMQPLVPRLCFQRKVIRVVFVVFVVFIRLVVNIIKVSLVIAIMHSIDRLPIHPGIGHIVDGLEDQSNDGCCEEKSWGGEIGGCETEEPDDTTNPG